MHQLCRHHGDAPLSKLGGLLWGRARNRAEKNAYDTAARLLELNARRLAVQTKRRLADKEILAKFAAGFAHVETPEQTNAVADVMADLSADTPMDRLLAADVGFGKTEVAMRAACVVALSSRYPVHKRRFWRRPRCWRSNMCVISKTALPTTRCAWRRRPE